MPTYDRRCGKCDELFTVLCKIADKHEKQHECPYCGSHQGEWMLCAPVSSIRPERFMTHKKDTGGFGQVLDKIKERNQRTEICER